MSRSKFIAFDFGAESGRAIVGILNDEKILLEEIHRFPNRQIKVDGHFHWDIFSLFEEIKTGLKIAVQKGHSDIQSIGIDTWGVDFGLIGEENNILGFPFCYRDSRTNGMMEKVFQKIPADDIYAATGIQFMQINSLFQLYYIKLFDDSIFNCTDKILFMPDLFNFLLTGEKKSEYTIASTSQLLNAKSKQFDKIIFSSLGLPIEKMAPTVKPGTVIGKLLPEIEKEVGFEDINVVSVGSHDTASAVAAVPAYGSNWAYISSGTWSLIGMETDEPIINDQSRQNNFTNEGGVNNKIRFLKNVMGLWFLQQTRISFQKMGNKLCYDEMSKMAYAAKPFQFILDPDDSSFLNPADMVEAIINYFTKQNKPAPNTDGEIVRCILESLAFKYKTVLSQINSMTGKKIERLHIVGGGSQNEVLNQFTADACGIPVIAGPVEATALGNILVQAIAKGKIESFEAGRKIIADSFPLKIYEPKNSKSWDGIKL